MEVGFMVFCAKHTVGLQQVHFKMTCTESVISVTSLAEVKGIPYEPDPHPLQLPFTFRHTQLALCICCLFMDLFHNKICCFKDTVNIPKFSSISSDSIFPVGWFAIMRFNFPNRDVFSGFHV